MFCHKCGAQIPDEAAFCPKCGTKSIHADDSQQIMDAPMPNVQPQDVPPAAPENTQKSKGKSPKIGTIGRVLMWGSLLLLFFSGLPIFAVGAVIGTILSVVGTKRPWGISKIIELVVAVIVLVIALVTTLSSGGSGDKYIQMVKGGTLNGYPQMTVGEAFDGFLENPKWESGLSDDNMRFVNVTGGILYFDEKAELAVQFIVDEKNESFQYNACEIDGVPQNNLVFWSLLESIYDDDSTSASSDLQGDSNFISDRIVLDETQSYDNEFGNIEVTLNYVAFTDKIENAWTGNYEYPDEGNVFLWAAITVKNIGTGNGDLLTAWNTIVYDGIYEYRSYATIGDSLTEIAPLTPPTEGAIIFEIPSSVMESDKSLVLNINDGGGRAVISFIIRAGNGTASKGEASLGPVSSMDEAQRLAETWLLDHPIGNGMAGFGTGAAANDVPSISAEYFVLELWEEPREFCGLVYVRKSDGHMTFHDSITDEEYELDAWYESTYNSPSFQGEMRYIMDGDEYSDITLYQDGTFSMNVNLYVGSGTLSGSYSSDDYGIYCNVETRDFQGYMGDDVTEFELAFVGEYLIYHGEAIGTTMDGVSFYQDIS